MKELICPNCGTPFQVDDNHYAAIVAQVRNELLNQEIDRRTAEIEKQFEAKLQASAASANEAAVKASAAKDEQIAKLRETIAQLKGDINGFNNQKEADMAKLKSEKEGEIAALKAQIASIDLKHQLDLEQVRNSNQEALQTKTTEITKLNAELTLARTTAEKTVGDLEKQHSVRLREKQDEIDYLRDYKARLSVKMLGENLEQHCAITFEQAKTYGIFPNATFEKDNDSSSSGTKGDFIFRDSVDGQEYISVMFEMKNEQEGTAKKHKNIDFLAKLDRDRQNKGCEYAVLVSMLEQDNPMYEAGIVDMSHMYPKMIVIRPQFLMPLLRVLTEAGKNNLSQIHKLNEELTLAREQSKDVTTLWKRISNARDTFDKNVTTAREKYEKAITGIDRVIETLEKQIADLRKVKANFDASEQKLLKANEVFEKDFTIKKLTHGSPALRKQLEEADSDITLLED